VGWLDKLKRKPQVNNTYAQMLDGYTPIFSQFGQNIYASDVVQQAISCIVSECVKLLPTHIREIGADVTPVSGNVQNVLNYPNETMTTSEFIEKFVWNLFFNYNSWIIPTFYEWRDEKTGQERRYYTGLYPVQPTGVEFQQDGTNKLWVKLSFANGYETTLPYSDVIHIKHHFSVNEFMGGNANGQPDNQSLLKTLQLNKDLLDGVSQAMKSSFAINGVVKFNTMLDDGKTAKAIAELEAKLKANESGFLPLDLKSEFTPLNHNTQLVDADTLKFIDEKILRHFGVSLPILTGDYTKAQYEAFYQKTIEPLVVHMSNAFTKTLFTDGEKSHHNKIKFYAKDLIFMSIDQKIQMLKELAPTGAFLENEKRVMFGMLPLKELEGKRYISLNWIEADKANQYQTGEESGDSGTETESN
jgi:HK97 family phage portal protein